MSRLQILCPQCNEPGSIAQSFNLIDYGASEQFQGFSNPEAIINPPLTGTIQQWKCGHLFYQAHKSTSLTLHNGTRVNASNHEL